jgi:hypothetical protein
MVVYVDNPPDAVSLMTSARSFGNYDLAGALADLIDNSLKAKSKSIWLICHFNRGNPEVRVIDDGYGMSVDELHKAMRPASQNPSEDRSADDLGRFGWGMKSASLSQCKKLTVITRRDGDMNGASWDLDNLDSWKMGVLSETEIGEQSSSEFPENTGTEIIWSDCDRLSENGSITEPGFNSLVTHTRHRLALIFHRYLSGKVRGKRLSMFLNGQELEAYDPFYTENNATQSLDEEVFRVEGKKVSVRPYILPHFSKLTRIQQEGLEGEEGFLKNQGFYVYRNHRLIISGTWFRLAKFGELSQLVRISVDIPNSLDDLWKITVDKSDAQLPTVLRDKLKIIIDRVRKRSFRVYRSKGGKLSSATNVAVWDRYAKNGEVTYRINKTHPLIAKIIESPEGVSPEALTAAFQAIEQGFPVEAFSQDASKRPADILQTAGTAEQFREFLNLSLPLILAEESGDWDKFKDRLKKTEPYSQNWAVVSDFLSEKGWINAKS